MKETLMLFYFIVFSPLCYATYETLSYEKKLIVDLLITKNFLNELYFGDIKQAKFLLQRNKKHIIPDYFYPIQSIDIYERDCVFYVRVNGIIQDPQMWAVKKIKIIDQDFTSELFFEFYMLGERIKDSVEHRQSKGMCH